MNEKKEKDLNYTLKLGYLVNDFKFVDDFSKDEKMKLTKLKTMFQHQLNVTKDDKELEGLQEVNKREIDKLYKSAKTIEKENWYGRSHMKDERGYTAFSADGKPTHFPGKGR